MQSGPNVKSVCVVTHHKTGTVWLRRVFQAVAATQGKGLHLSQRDSDAPKIRRLLDQGPCFLFAGNGLRPTVLDDYKDVIVIHMIRDPRDILLSGLEYHLRHVPSRGSPETFIHLPRERFGGLTYQQMLRSLPARRDQLRFEMNHRHNRTVNQMLTWDYDNPNHVEWRYEDMMRDTDQTRFEAAVTRLGYDADARPAMCKAFWKESLFGGAASAAQTSTHVLSGKLRRWHTELPYAFAALYAKRFSKALAQLGYEEDLSWLDRLRDELP